MSAQGIRKSLNTLRHDIDRSLSCIGTSYITSEKFGLGQHVNLFDVSRLIYFKKLLERKDCDIKLDDCLIEEVSKMTLKYS